MKGIPMQPTTDKAPVADKARELASREQVLQENVQAFIAACRALGEVTPGDPGAGTQNAKATMALGVLTGTATRLLATAVG